jgi:hypothetical protein
VALRRYQFSKPNSTELAAETVQEAVTKLGEILRANVGYNPTHVPGTQGLPPALTQQFKGMQNADPGEKQQKALLFCVYRELHRVAIVHYDTSSDLDSRIANILTLAFFFCMRSCEYSEVQGERRTKLLRVGNIRFFDENNRDTSKNTLILHQAASVTLTFEFQKRDVRNAIILHQRSNDLQGEGEMCPVKAAAAIVQRRYIQYTPSKFQDTQINLDRSGDMLYTIPSTTFLQRIRLIVDSLGQEKLGFTSADVGTHLNFSGGAMGMFLAGTPVYKIMLMG